MTSDRNDAVFSLGSPYLEEGGVGGDGGDSDTDDELRENDDVIIPETNEEEEDLNSPSTSRAMISTVSTNPSSTGAVTVALPARSTVPLFVIPVDSKPKWLPVTEIVNQRPAIDDSRRLFQRLWTDEDEIELLSGFLDYITTHRGNSSHPPDTAPFYEQIKSKLQLDFNKNQLVEKLRRLKKKYRNVMTKFSTGKEVFFKSPHDQSTFEISRKIWNQTGKFVGFEDTNNNVMDLDDHPGNNINGNFSTFNSPTSNPTLEIDSENGVVKKLTVSSSSSVSRKRSRSRIGKIEEDNNIRPINLSDVQIPNAAINVNLNETTASAAAAGVGGNLKGLIEETVKNCVSPVIKEMMNGTTTMMMAAMGGFAGSGGGSLSPMFTKPLSFSFGLGGGGGNKAGMDERWRKQQILELEVYSRRLELVQEQIRATLHELKTTPIGQ